LLASRLDTLIPMLMARAALDAWVLVAREYNEDPVLATMLPATWLDTARRRTILLFLRTPSGVRRMAVARYPVGDAFPSAWDPEQQPDQWQRLAELLGEADPPRIGVDTSTAFPLADGLSASERAALMAALPPELAARVVSAEAAAIGWLETRLPEERSRMADACSASHGYLRRALSAEVITPGTTTTAEVEWWLRDAVGADGFGSWFQPTCSVQRRGTAARESFAGKLSETVIGPGDLVHIDFGIVDGGYCTDQQQHAYVLRPGEAGAPAGLAAGLARANRLQDLLLARFESGRSGNEVLRLTLEAAAAEALDGLVYTHPIGLHGHAAGPTIGLWDNQVGVDGQGDYPVWPSTAYSIELQARVPVPEWDGQVVAFMLEEDAFFDGSACCFLDGRQAELWLV
ncbi:MAG TPA: M24 family metallopeptidase, partial [Candidatus Limnocylindrales bacterium]|nr:M24 family metallopeptidase [Candidatus Limnocylindrales bacterium]